MKTVGMQVSSTTKTGDEGVPCTVAACLEGVPDAAVGSWKHQAPAVRGACGSPSFHPCRRVHKGVVLSAVPSVGVGTSGCSGLHLARLPAFHATRRRRLYGASRGAPLSMASVSLYRQNGAGQMLEHFLAVRKRIWRNIHWAFRLVSPPLLLSS